jgi:predicted DNA binding CopG/RHH family protein
LRDGSNYLNFRRQIRAHRIRREETAEARKIGGRKGIGYQTLLKMLVHEGLARVSARG